MFITDCSTESIPSGSVILDNDADARNLDLNQSVFERHAPSGTRTWNWKHPFLSDVFRNESTLISPSVYRQTPICVTNRNTLNKTAAAAVATGMAWARRDRSFADKTIQITPSISINPNVFLKISTRVITIGTICLQLRVARKYLVQCFLILFVDTFV